MKKGTMEVAAAMADLHEFLGDSYLDIMASSGFRNTCPTVGWHTELVAGKPVTEATLLWDEPAVPERVGGLSADALVDEVCLRVIRRLRAVEGN